MRRCQITVSEVNYPSEQSTVIITLITLCELFTLTWQFMLSTQKGSHNILTVCDYVLPNSPT